MLRHVIAIAAVVAAWSGPAPAAGPAQGLTCGLSAETVYGGPVVFTGELATSVIYHCTVRVVAPSGPSEQHARFESPGPVGVLPPTAVRVDANATRVEVCTLVEWVFGFPGGGAVDAGCREATPGALGYELTPDLIT